MDSKPLAASSSTSGFFQAIPTIPPQYTTPHSLPQKVASQHQDAVSASDDKVLARILELYIPPNATQVAKHLHHLARLSLHPSVLMHSTDAETNHPVLRPLTTFGEENRSDPLWVTTGWQALKEIGYYEGTTAVAFEKQNEYWNRRVYAFALGHVWSSTATMTGCPMAMTDGAATLLSRHLNDEDGDQPGRKAVFKEAYRRLTSRDPVVAWTSGQWMTERTGGSDVSGTETVARRLTDEELAHDATAGRDRDAIGMPLGPWTIDGFKWFSSATDSEMSVLLARTSKGGLSLFYIPMRRLSGKTIPTIDGRNREHTTELNGIRIQRLKNKLGTKSLPTAELELKGARGWMVGTEGKGVQAISAVLNITRLYTSAGSAANWSRALAIARAYSKVRKVRGGLLQDNAVHLRWMADETVKYAAGAHFAFLGVALQGTLEQDWEKMVRGTRAEKLIPENKTDSATLLRLMTPVMKAQVSVASVNGIRECMECLGGVGYCENNEDGGLMNIAKVFRDNLVNPIWEGTVSVMAEDVVRVLVDKRVAGGNVIGNVFAPWVNKVLSTCSSSFQSEISIVKKRMDTLQEITLGVSKEELLYRGRNLLTLIEFVVCSSLLMYDATVNPSEAATAIATRWISLKPSSGVDVTSVPSSKDGSRTDKLIFLGDGDLKSANLGKL